jgi:hypothetical protein
MDPAVTRPRTAVLRCAMRQRLSMDVATFHASRRFAEVKSGRIAYFEAGHGPAALFIHGVPLNGYHWRHVIERVRPGSLRLKN